MIQKLLPRAGQVIGITGNICSGKSFALKHFAKRGFKTVSIDSLVHKAMQEDNDIKQKIREIFPEVLKNGNKFKNFFIISGIKTRLNQNVFSFIITN